MRLTCNRVACVALAVAITAVAGCGSRRADISGRMTYQGKTIEVGSVTLLGVDGLPVICAINGGRYSGNVPVGSVRVGINSFDPAVQLQAYQRDGAVPADIKAELTAQRAKWFPVPGKFGDPRASGLVINVTGTGETFDFDLQ